MDKTYTINTPEYQDAQEAFFNYNVVGNMEQEAEGESTNGF
jgi:hypothetical protein